MPSEDIANAWDHFDKLKLLQEQSSPGTPSDAILLEDHVCGSRCPFLTEDDNGSFVCPLSGMVFGQQTALGFSTHSFLTTAVHPPSDAPKPRARRIYGQSKTELYSIAVQQTCRLLKENARKMHAERKESNARKSAFKHFLAAKDQVKRKGGCLLRATESVYSTFERYGGGVVERKFSDRRISITAETICSMHHRLWVPYSAKSEHRPTRQHFCIAALYIIAEGHFGKKLFDPLLDSYLPDLKSLSQFKIKVNQVTNALRFIKEAICFVQKAKP